MAFILEDGTGVEDSNAYIDVVFYKDYQKTRGVTVTQGGGAIQAAIIRATDYMEARWRFVGFRETNDQGLHWPALDAFYYDGRVANDVPIEVQESCADYTKIELDTPGGLLISSTYDESGGVVLEKREKVGPIEEETKFGDGGAKQTFKKFPGPDQRLKRAGLVLSGSQLLRA